MDSSCPYMMLKAPEIAHIVGMSYSNLRTTYIKTPNKPKVKKQAMLRALDMGSFCIKHNISHTELELLAKLSGEIKNQMMNKMKEINL